MTADQITEIETAVLEQADGLVTAQNNLDADSFMSRLSSERFFWVNNYTPYASFDAMEDFISDLLAGIDTFNSGWNELNVTVLSEKAALSHGSWWGEQIRGNQVTKADTIWWTALHELHEGGSWKITRVHQSWDTPVVEGVG
jgi:hypothetical protein